MKKIVPIVIVAGLILGGFALWAKSTLLEGGKVVIPSKLEGKRSGFQAVFLTNGQVYFGKIAKRDTDYPELTEVYYLRVTQKLQEPATATQAAELEERVDEEAITAPAAPGRDLTLIKLGNELHGPMDKITLNRDHILFIEDLKEDSKIVAAIKEFKKRQKEKAIEETEDVFGEEEEED